MFMQVPKLFSYKVFFVKWFFHIMNEPRFNEGSILRMVFAKFLMIDDSVCYVKNFLYNNLSVLQTYITFNIHFMGDERT